MGSIDDLTFWNILFVFLEQTLTFIKWDWPCLLARQSWGAAGGQTQGSTLLQNTQKIQNRKEKIDPFFVEEKSFPGLLGLSARYINQRTESIVGY